MNDKLYQTIHNIVLRNDLTEDDQDLLTCIGLNKSEIETAKEFECTVNQVKWKRRKLYKKLNKNEKKTFGLPDVMGIIIAELTHE